MLTPAAAIHTFGHAGEVLRSSQDCYDTLTRPQPCSAGDLLFFGFGQLEGELSSRPFLSGPGRPFRIATVGCVKLS